MEIECLVILAKNNKKYSRKGKNKPRFSEYDNDDNNLGAVKTTLYNNGTILTYVYGEKGKTVIQEIESHMDITEDEILHYTLSEVEEKEGIYIPIRLFYYSLCKRKNN